MGTKRNRRPVLLAPLGLLCMATLLALLSPTAWGLGILIAVVVLGYLVAGFAFFYIYHAAAARRTGQARLVRALFRRSAAEVDDHRSKLDPEILARSDARIVEHTKIYVKKALGCSVWILLLALTIFLVKNL